MRGDDNLSSHPQGATLLDPVLAESLVGYLCIWVTLSRLGTSNLARLGFRSLVVVPAILCLTFAGTGEGSVPSIRFRPERIEGALRVPQMCVMCVLGAKPYETLARLITKYP